MHGVLNEGTKGKCGTNKQTNEYEKDLKENQQTKRRQRRRKRQKNRERETLPANSS